MVPPDSTGIPRAPAYSGTLALLYSAFAYGTLTPSGPPFQARSASVSIRFPKAPQPRQGLTPTGLGSSHFARRYFGNRCCFLVLGLLRCLSSPRSPLLPMCSETGASTLPEAGCPIRKSPALSLLDGSPKLIAAYHVLRRLLAPRHPPFALNSLTTNIKPKPMN